MMATRIKGSEGRREQWWEEDEDDDEEKYDWRLLFARRVCIIGST
jgi:hypothetical protein